LSTSKEVKINIGCGNDIMEGYENIDLNSGPGITGRYSILNIDKVKRRNSVDEVYAKYIFEHLNYRDINLALYHISRVLKPKGRLIVIVPDFRMLLDWMDSDPQNSDVYFEQFFSDEYDSPHKSVWTEKNAPWLLTRDNQYRIVSFERDGLDLKYTLERVC
jgi:predicted SAM-dependent methyltransferase